MIKMERFLEGMIELKSGESDALAHYGVLGQKWGVRRYQNTDGTRTPAGLNRESVARAKGVALSKVKQTAADVKQRQHNKKMSKPLTSKQLAKLSPAEIQERLAKLDLEKKYHQAIQEQKKRNQDPIVNMDNALKVLNGVTKPIKYVAGKVGKATDIQFTKWLNQMADDAAHPGRKQERKEQEAWEKEKREMDRAQARMNYDRTKTEYDNWVSLGKHDKWDRAHEKQVLDDRRKESARQEQETQSRRNAEEFSKYSRYNGIYGEQSVFNGSPYDSSRVKQQEEFDRRNKRNN